MGGGGRRGRAAILVAAAGGVALLVAVPAANGLLLRALVGVPGRLGEETALLLARRGDPVGLARALALLAFGPPQVAWRAADALGQGGSEEALPFLVRRLNGADAKVSAACSKALVRATGRGASFEAEDPRGTRDGIVRDWNRWSREAGIEDGGGAPAGAPSSGWGSADP